MAQVVEVGGNNPLNAGSMDRHNPNKHDAFVSYTPMTVGVLYPGGRSLYINTTVAGNVSMTMQDSSIFVAPVAVGITVLPFTVIKINAAGTTATATYMSMS